MGDFNLPGVYWNAHISSTVNRLHADCMLEIMPKHSLIQVVNEPTRIQGQCHAILDLVFLSDGSFNCQIDVENGILDHKVIAATLRIDNKGFAKHCNMYVLKFQRADDTSILDHLEIALDTIPQENDVQRPWTYFKSTVADCISQFIPVRWKRVEKANLWITKTIIHLKRRLRRAQQATPRNPDTISILSAQVRNELKTARTTFFSTTLTNYMLNSLDRFWRYMTNLKPAITAVRVNDSICSKPDLMEKELNHLFCSVFSPGQLDTGIAGHLWRQNSNFEGRSIRAPIETKL